MPSQKDLWRLLKQTPPRLLSPLQDCISSHLRDRPTWQSRLHVSVARRGSSSFPKSLPSHSLSHLKWGHVHTCSCLGWQPWGHPCLCFFLPSPPSLPVDPTDLLQNKPGVGLTTPQLHLGLSKHCLLPGRWVFSLPVLTSPVLSSQPAARRNLFKQAVSVLSSDSCNGPHFTPRGRARKPWPLTIHPSFTPHSSPAALPFPPLPITPSLTLFYPHRLPGNFKNSQAHPHLRTLASAIPSAWSTLLSHATNSLMSVKVWLCPTFLARFPHLPLPSSLCPPDPPYCVVCFSYITSMLHILKYSVLYFFIVLVVHFLFTHLH